MLLVFTTAMSFHKHSAVHEVVRHDDRSAQGVHDVMKLSVRIANYRYRRADRWGDLQRSALVIRHLGDSAWRDGG